MISPSTKPTLFPYTTLFRSRTVTYRNPGQATTGFFQVSGLFGSGSAGAGVTRTIVAVFDTSLSMQWNKLDASFQAFETVLRSLRSEEHTSELQSRSDLVCRL